jgi:hypothetical protein
MRRFIGCFLLGFAGMAACQNADEKKDTSSPEVTAPKEQPRSNFTEEGTIKLMSLLGEYYALKDALVASDAAKTTEQAVKLQMSADSMQRFISDSTHILYVQVKEIKAKAGEIVLSKADVEKQRIPFEKLSDAVFTLIKEANLKNAGVYRQYCPMAFNDKGAYWLSPEEKIRNPYFGKKMLTCGEVTDSLK